MSALIKPKVLVKRMAISPLYGGSLCLLNATFALVLVDYRHMKRCYWVVHFCHMIIHAFLETIERRGCHYMTAMALMKKLNLALQRFFLSSSKVNLN